jgi:GxxExxY protein
MDPKTYPFPHAELTRQILEASFEVINELGAGYLESVYEKALRYVLTQKGLEVKSQVPISVYFRGQNVGQFFADLLVEEKIIVELKATSHLTSEHKAQVINYLKSTGIEAGLLINFGNSKLEFYRLHP